MDLKALLRKYAARNALDHGEAREGAVIGKVFAENPDLKERAGEVTQAAEDVIDDVNALSEDELEDIVNDHEYDDGSDEEHDPIPDLQDTEDGVVVRFAPNPNGPPTLGSSRGMVINGELKQKYDGKLILRFDDTDPRTKRPLPKAYDWYQEDYAWLGYEVDEVRYSSKNFDTYIEKAEQLIDQHEAYVCECSPEEGRQYREDGEACPHRGRSIEKNLELWEQMKDGGIAEGEATLKIKTELEHKNPAVRDFVAFRIIEDADHPITGDEYRVWPLLDFAGAIEDHVMGTTHIVRGKDLRASTERQKYIYDYLGWDYPKVRYWGRVSIGGFDAPMSTSSLSQMIQDGELDGWSDPRAPTLRALRRRGFDPEALADFWVDMGVTENDADVALETLHSFNRKAIDADADRYFFVNDPEPVVLLDTTELTAEIPYHPQEDRGSREVHVTSGPSNSAITVLISRNDLSAGLIRLKDLCNIEIDELDGEPYIAEVHSISHEPAIEAGAEIIQWVPDTAKPCEILMPDGSVVHGKCEPDVPEGVVQFVRFGFVNIVETGDTVSGIYTHS